MRNSEIVKEYRRRIEDFKEIYHEDVKLPIGSIDNYEEAYLRELEIVSNFEFKEYHILLNYVDEDIANFVSDKRELGFTPNASRLTLGVLKGKFISKPPIEDNDENIKILADSIYRVDPWGQVQPRNDDELEMHREWWNIELWKHQIINDYFFKNKGIKSQAKPASYKGELSKKCIQDIEKCAKEYPDLGINKFFETAHTQYESCRKAVKIIGGEKKSVNISPSKLRDEIKKRGRADIYYRNRSPRKK